MTRLFFILAIFSISTSLKSQELSDVITGGRMGFMGGVTYIENGVKKYLYIDDGTDKSFQGFGSLQRKADRLSDMIIAEAYVLLELPDYTLQVSPAVEFSELDFRGPEGSATSTIAKPFDITIPKNLPAGGILRMGIYGRLNGGENMEIIVDDWEVEVIVSSKITGPDQICDEGIYTITNPGTISLENATGVANLTNLGNNQWKVERINNAVGTVVLKSLVGSNAYEKNIRIGNQAPTSITGNSFSLDWSRSYTFTVNTVDANSTLEIVKEGAPSVTFTRLDNNRFTLSTPPKPNSNDPITPVYVLNIKARVIDPECGNSEYIHQEIRVGSTIPFE